MPVTFSPAKHAPKPFDPNSSSGPSSNTDGGIAARILQNACYQQYRQSDEILQSSFDNLENESWNKEFDIIPQSNGFVDTVLHAYNQHRVLVIRPDDVWLAILVQFGSFINANSETLRSQFVRHKGKKELTVKGDRRNVDYEELASKMTEKIEENVVDPTLRAWVLPDFSTTTVNDTTVCSIVMMATMKKYFTYKIQLLCGIPRVTLAGEKADWEKILVRLDKLKEYGLHAIAWYHLLHPIIVRFVRAFDAPDSEENLDFWQKVAHYSGGGSGPRYLSGWITAFCVFDDEGKWLGNPIKKDVKELPDARSLPIADFSATYTEITLLPPRIRHFIGDGAEQVYLKLDGVQYHFIDSQDVPSGYSEVDVLLDDDGTEYKCMMVAGAVGMRVSSSEAGGAKDMVEPVAGWWMFTKQPEGKFRDEHYGGDDGDDGNAPVPHHVLGGSIAGGSEKGPTELGGEVNDQKESKPGAGQIQDGAGCCKCIIM
ncbi:hypothetical protein D9613_003406 [Agrocybe pediades]|uniref:Uncharacterized protein n=1 Tax=Agrocybe pediades TaxID=84607 RepID=A0A8H4QPZ1_9AGAR|nr:hypothetical protein D9613_003406 [Agrocybe pediades]